MHRNDRNDRATHHERYDDRDTRWRPEDDDSWARERQDQQRWATDRDDFGGGMRRRDLERDRDRGRTRDDEMDTGSRERWTSRDDDMQSAGWGRDDYGFRGPSFRERDDLRDPDARHRRDRWEGSGGYSEDRGQYDRGVGGMGSREMGGRDMQHRRGMGSYGSEYRGRDDGDRGRSSAPSEYGRGRDGGMPGRGDARYGSGPVPGEGSMRTSPSHRGKGPKNFTRSDERIREDVCERLEDCDIDASNIEVRVTNCEVTLEGTVEDRRAKREAEDVACEARGVKQVHNLLRVGSSSDQTAGSTQSYGGRATSTGNGERQSDARRS